LDKAIADDADMEKTLAFAKFTLLNGKGGDPAKAQDYGKRLVETVFKDSADGLNNLAWMIVDPDAAKPDAKMIQVALQAALRADELSKGKNAAVADTLAKAYFDSGDAAKALKTQERALELAKGTPLEKDPSLKERLEMYKKALPK